MHIVCKKDVHIILHNEPLLFIDGPPIVIRELTTVEESTSVFVSNQAVEEEESKTNEEEIQSVALVNPSIVKKLTELSEPFHRQVYKPLTFIAGDELLRGKVQKVEGEIVYIELDHEKDTVLPVDISKIQKVLWRGEPFE